MSQSSHIMPTIVLITGHFLKFRGIVKIPWQRGNSAARLEITRPADNCGPYLSELKCDRLAFSL